MEYSECNMKKIKILVYACKIVPSILVLLVVSLVAGDSMVYAETQAECGVKSGTSIIKCESGENPIQGMLLYFSRFALAGVGVLCIIGIGIGGIIYATAGGDTGKTKQGIQYIVNAVIALVIFAFLAVILNFMVPGGFWNNAGLDSSPDTGGGGADAGSADGFRVLRGE